MKQYWFQIPPSDVYAGIQFHIEAADSISMLDTLQKRYPDDWKDAIFLGFLEYSKNATIVTPKSKQ